MEGSIDLQELEKLSPHLHRKHGNITEKPVHKPEKWRPLLEPVLVGAMVAINLVQTSVQNFYIRTACVVDLGNSSQLCDGKLPEDLEAASQSVVSSVNISRSFIGSLISTVVLLFVGPWSDCSGRRKPLLLMPLIGMSIMSSALILMVTFPGANTTQVLYAVQIPMSVCGNFGLLLAAAFSHIGDVCHATGRDVTKTMGAHRAAIQVSHVIGSVGGPLLFRTFGYYGVFPIVLLLQLSSLVYVIFAVKDVNVNEENEVSVLNWRLPFNAINCIFKQRDGHRRAVILLMLAVSLGERAILSAEVLVAYMFYRYKFGWGDVMFGSFLAYRNIIGFLGTLLILTVLKRRLKVSDEMVGFYSCISYIMANSCLTVTNSSYVVFLLPLVGIIAQGNQVVQRPLLNKQILPTEQGKIYSVMGATEAAVQTVSSPLYSLLYKKTVASRPEAWLYPGIILASLQSLAYLLAKNLGHKKQETPEQKQPLNSSEKVKDVSNIRLVNSTEKIKDDSNIPLRLKNSTEEIKDDSNIPIQLVNSSKEIEDDSNTPLLVNSTEKIKDDSKIPLQLVNSTDKIENDSSIPLRLVNSTENIKDDSNIPQRLINSTEKGCEVGFK